MNNDKQEYLMIRRWSGEWYKELSHEELQQVMGRLKVWFDGLSEKGLVKAGEALGSEGRLVSGKDGRVVSDGPFAESKETIAGFMLILAENLDEAVKIAQGCPVLAYGDTIEVRPVAEECPMTAYAREVLGGKELAGAGV